MRVQERVNMNVPAQVVAKGLSKLAQIVVPWVGWLLMLAGGFILHTAWHSPLTALGVGALGLLVGLFTRYLTHQRGMVGQWLAPITVWLTTGWLVLVDLRGVLPELALWFIVGSAVCITWNIWTGVHAENGADGIGFLKGAEAAGVEGLKLSSIKTLAHKITAIVHMPKGQMITEDLNGRLRHIESGMGIPRGALQTNIHKDDASLSHLTVSDPRALDQLIPWPGPSIPHGGSMADLLRTGKWQDGSYLEYLATNTHVLANGTTGAGKTKSFAYNEMAETVTRYDGGVLAMDVAKRRQFLGPMEAALHRFETTPDGVCELMQNVHLLVAERADFLGERGYEKWEKGCGLIHWTIWMEEAPDIIKILDDADLYDDFVSDARNMRSAGMRLVMSLQRPTFDQIPPTVRSMLDYLCFGLKNGSDEAYALSDRQKAADCSPAMWSNKHPGMSYFDSLSIDEEHCTMPNRWFTWGDNADQIRAHCNAYPASDRPADHLSAARLGLPLADVGRLGNPPITDPRRPAMAGQSPGQIGQGTVAGQPEATRPTTTLIRPPGRPQPNGNGGQPKMPRTYEAPPGWKPPRDLPAPQPDPEFWDYEGHDLNEDDIRDAVTGEDPETGGPVMPLPPAGSEEFDFSEDDQRAPGEKWAPEEARAAFTEMLSEWRAQGVTEFSIGDVMPLAGKVGMGRSWLYKVCEQFCKNGVLHKKPNTYPQKFVINRVSE
jgi:hypothetical protein